MESSVPAMRDAGERRDQLAQRLREARQRAGLTQVDVAERLGWPQSFVSKLENAERRIDFFVVEDLAAIYGRSLTYFRTRP